MKILKEVLKEWVLLVIAIAMLVVLVALLGIKVHDSNKEAHDLVELLSGVNLHLQAPDEPQIRLEILESSTGRERWRENAAFTMIGQQVVMRVRVKNLPSSAQLDELDFIYNDEVVAVVSQPDVLTCPDGTEVLGLMQQELTLTADAWKHGVTDEISVTTKGDFELVSSAMIAHPLYYVPYKMIMFYVILITLALGIIILICVSPTYQDEEE